jgi:hypothetical protein
VVGQQIWWRWGNINDFVHTIGLQCTKLSNRKQRWFLGAPEEGFNAQLAQDACPADTVAWSMDIFSGDWVDKARLSCRSP